jgi:hypothetical protein
MASDLGRSHGSVAAWKNRNAIPHDVFPQLVVLAPMKGLKGITLELLHSLQRGDAQPAKRAGSKKKPFASTRTAA